MISANVDSPDAGWCLAALGNPGPKYANNRHNAGRLYLEFLIHDWNAVDEGTTRNCQVWRSRQSGADIRLAVPNAYMNENGPPLADLFHFFKIPPNHILILHDDIDLPLGRLQLKLGGSSAGHRGVESLYHALGNPDFYRLRIGVGRPDRSAKDYVLSDFTAEENKTLAKIFRVGSDGIDLCIRGECEKAAQKLNTEG